MLGSIVIRVLFWFWSVLIAKQISYRTGFAFVYIKRFYNANHTRSKVILL